MELAILAWFAVAAGIVAGAFLIARAAVQLADVAYRVWERRLARAEATRQSALLLVAIAAALGVTALIASAAILAALAELLLSAPEPPPE